jgi:two-component system response regulator HydG
VARGDDEGRTTDAVEGVMGSLRILVVDDDADFAETLRDILEGRGHAVELAYDGENAVRVFSERHFDLCFMDVSLPGRNGVESFAEMRKARRDARVVMMTGFSVEDLLARALDDGAWAVLHKPLDLARVLDMLSQVGSRGLILVVDDDPDFGVALQDALSAAGYRSLVAREGPAALEALRRQHVDVMVLDIRLPVMNGLEVYLTAKREGIAVPTVVVTGYAAEEAASLEDLRAAAVDQVLVKPVAIPELLRVVEHAALRV